MICSDIEMADNEDDEDSETDDDDAENYFSQLLDTEGKSTYQISDDVEEVLHQQWVVWIDWSEWHQSQMTNMVLVTSEWRVQAMVTFVNAEIKFILDDIWLLYCHGGDVISMIVKQVCNIINHWKPAILQFI